MPPHPHPPRETGALLLPVARHARATPPPRRPARRRTKRGSHGPQGSPGFLHELQLQHNHHRCSRTRNAYRAHHLQWNDHAQGTRMGCMRTSSACGNTAANGECYRGGHLCMRSVFRSLRSAGTPHQADHAQHQETLHHHQVGELILGFEELALDSSPSITLSAYIAKPASPTAERLQLLATWAATTAAAHP
ncbi:MmyB family transcriptional regulator [Streptomyces sp. NPDC004288]